MKLIKTNILNGLFFLFSVFPLIPNTVKGFPVVLLFIGALIFYKKNKINWKWLLINSSLFIIYLISIMYSDDYFESFKKLETSLSILILPITFIFLLSGFKITNYIKGLFTKVFIISTTLFSIISVSVIFLKDLEGNYKWNTDRNREIVMDMPLIGQHPIYASIFISLAIIFFIHILKNNTIKTFQEKLFFLSAIIMNILALFTLLSKGVIIALFVLVFFYTILSKMLRIYKYLVMGFMILSLVTLFLFSRRMSELINPETYTEFNPNLSTSIRLGIYDCSLEIIKRKWLLGYGIGDAQRTLNLCYANKSDILLMHRFNSHNQYLDILIKTGIVGLLIFFSFLIQNLSLAFKNKNQLIIMIIIFYGIIFITENILSRQSGVILFFFLISFFNDFKKSLYKNNHDEKS